MSMLPYPPPYMKQDAGENSLMRVLGGVLALLSLILTLLGIIFHQHVVDLILAIIVAIFALRVLILWLGDKGSKVHSLYPTQSRLSQPLQPLPPYASQHLPVPPSRAMPYPAQYGQQPVRYAVPYPQSRPLYNAVPDPHMEQTVAIPPTQAAQMAQMGQTAQTPPRLPRSVRPQRPPEAPAFPAQGAAPQYMAQPQPTPPMPVMPPTTPALQMSPTAAIPPTQAAPQSDVQWLPPSYAAVPAPAPIPAPTPRSEHSSSWQYDDEQDIASQQGGNSYGSA